MRKILIKTDIEWQLACDKHSELNKLVFGGDTTIIVQQTTIRRVQ